VSPCWLLILSRSLRLVKKSRSLRIWVGAANWILFMLFSLASKYKSARWLCIGCMYLTLQCFLTVEIISSFLFFPLYWSIVNFDHSTNILKQHRETSYTTCLLCQESLATTVVRLLLSEHVFWNLSCLFRWAVRKIWKYRMHFKLTKFWTRNFLVFILVVFIWIRYGID
jgi:hypothetical protein